MMKALWREPRYDCKWRPEIHREHHDDSCRADQARHSPHERLRILNMLDNHTNGRQIEGPSRLVRFKTRANALVNELILNDVLTGIDGHYVLAAGHEPPSENRIVREDR